MLVPLCKHKRALPAIEGIEELIKDLGLHTK
jgi:hypothetical protein